MNVLTLTPEAYDYVQRKLTKEPPQTGLRLGLRKTGCSGLAYDIAFTQIVPNEETVIEAYDDIKIVMDLKNLTFFKGTIIDCVKDDFGEYLKFQNPNVKGECGCGESFTVTET